MVLGKPQDHSLQVEPSLSLSHFPRHTSGYGPARLRPNTQPRFPLAGSLFVLALPANDYIELSLACLPYSLGRLD